MCQPPAAHEGVCEDPTVLEDTWDYATADFAMGATPGVWLHS